MKPYFADRAALCIEIDQEFFQDVEIARCWAERKQPLALIQTESDRQVAERKREHQTESAIRIQLSARRVQLTSAIPPGT